ncbi:MAG: hypothetical protein RL563_477, partial [Pseudomonadota bacterium]
MIFQLQRRLAQVILDWLGRGSAPKSASNPLELAYNLPKG